MNDPLSLSHPMYRSPEANRFFWNTIHRKRVLEYYRPQEPQEPSEPQDDG